jgi:hypothetical protein
MQGWLTCYSDEVKNHPDAPNAKNFGGLGAAPPNAVDCADI